MKYFKGTVDYGYGGCWESFWFYTDNEQAILNFLYDFASMDGWDVLPDCLCTDDDGNYDDDEVARFWEEIDYRVEEEYDMEVIETAKLEDKLIDLKAEGYEK